jgi:hypothetical protein
MKRRLISVLLVLAMIFTVAMPAGIHAIAEEETATQLALWDFEENDEGWTFVDSDGDGFNWIWHTNQGSSTGQYSAYSGYGKIYSESYDSDSYSALYPDNWAVSPAFSLVNTVDPFLSLWAVGQDPDWADEVFALYAGVSPVPSEMIKVGGDFTASGDYQNFTADLSDFIDEETVYIAVRHYNSSDMFVLNIDYVQIMATVLPDHCAPGTHVLTECPATTEATCTEGVHCAYYQCDVCHRLFLDEEGLQEVLLKDIITEPALGHNWATCTSNNDGTHTHSCSRCDATLTEGCTFEEIVKDGVSKKWCTECGYATYSEISGENLLVGWGFEDEESIEGWTMSDEDGDGYCWWWGEGEDNAHEGNRFLYSASYYSGALTPDNWLFTPAFSLEGYKEARVSLWASGYSPSWYDEVFAVYAGTSADPDDMVMISEDITTESGYLNYTFDLTAFAGEEAVYVAIRHYNCTDVYYLLLDLVEIYATGADICEVHDLTFVPAVAPTATEDGNIDYYYCEECGRYYLDEDATQPVLYEDVIIPALGENAPQFTSHRLVLTGEVGVQFKVTLPEGFDETGSSVSFAVSDGRTSTVDIADATPVEGENAYWFTCFINALELADTIKATFNYGTDGAVIDTYSAMDYITTIMETYDELSQSFCLVRDLRNYGHYLQLSGWTDGKDHEEIPAYEGSVLSEVDLEYTRNALPAENYEVVKNIEGTGIEDVKFALTLNSQQVINFFVKLAEGEEIVSYEGCTPKGTQIIGGYTYYKFNTEEINVIDIFKDYTVKIETVSGTAEITASALTYIATVIKEGSTFPAEKQYAMVAYYYYISYARYVLNSQN